MRRPERVLLRESQAACGGCLGPGEAMAKGARRARRLMDLMSIIVSCSLCIKLFSADFVGGSKADYIQFETSSRLRYIGSDGSPERSQRLHRPPFAPLRHTAADIDLHLYDLTATTAPCTSYRIGVS